MTLGELCEKTIVDVNTGANLGKVDDICFEEAAAQITHIIIYGQLKLFGLLGREKDTLIPWADIRKIGTDMLLIDTACQIPKKSKKNVLAFLTKP